MSDSAAALSDTSAIHETRALAFLHAHHVAHTVHLYPYVDKGGAQASTAALGLKAGHVVKTLIFHHSDSPLCVLAPGNATVDSRALAKALALPSRAVRMCEAERAQELTGYLVGGTSPFGLLSPMPVFIDSKVSQLRGDPELGSSDDSEPVIFINGGARGCLVRLNLSELMRTIAPKVIDVCKRVVG